MLPLNIKLKRSVYHEWVTKILTNFYIFLSIWVRNNVGLWHILVYGDIEGGVAKILTFFICFYHFKNEIKFVYVGLVYDTFWCPGV